MSEVARTPEWTHIACPCTTFEQDEDCPVGFPSLLCSVCDGKGVATVDDVVALAAEMLKIADQVGELEDPFAAWETIEHARADRVDAAAAEKERLRFEGDLDKWMKIIGAGITGSQPEAYAVMDWACEELVRLRATNRELTDALKPFRKVAGYLFERNYNASDIVLDMTLEPKGKGVFLRAGDFFPVAAALNGGSDAP